MQTKEETLVDGSRRCCLTPAIPEQYQGHLTNLCQCQENIPEGSLANSHHPHTMLRD